MKCYSAEGDVSSSVIRCFFSILYENHVIAGPRIRLVRDAPVAPGSDFILYWMIASRRLAWNFALDRAIACYSLDGRDPNTYSGIFWTLGRYDRPWGPERPIFGTVRYMSSENTVRRLRMKAYLARWGDDARRLSRS